MIIESMRTDNKSTIQLPERNKLLLYLHGLMLLTGRVDVMYCNAFLDEARQVGAEKYRIIFSKRASGY